MPQTPSLQVGVALVGAVQSVSQAPQCSMLVIRSTHSLPHLLPLPVQSSVHTPSEHTCPAAHALPQAPQLSTLELVSTQLPLQLV